MMNITTSLPRSPSLHLNFNFTKALGNLDAYQDTVTQTSELDVLTADQYLSTCTTNLLTCARWQNELEDLGIPDPAAIAHQLGVGYCQRHRNTSQRPLNPSDAHALIGSYQRTGLYKPNGCGRLWGQYTFPLYCPQGTLVGVYGFYRCPYIEHARENIHLFPNIEFGLFNAGRIRHEHEVVLTNDPMTACRLWPQQPNVLAVVSHHVDVAKFIQWLKLLQLRRVVICTEPGAFHAHWKTALVQALDALKIEHRDGS